MKSGLFIIGFLSACLSAPASAASVIYSEYSPFASYVSPTQGLTGGAEASFIADSGALDFQGFEGMPLSNSATLTSVTADGFSVEANITTRLQVANGAFGGNHAAGYHPGSNPNAQFLWVVDSNPYNSRATLTFDRPINEFALTITDAHEIAGFRIETDHGFSYSPFTSIGTDSNELFFGLIDSESSFTTVSLIGRDPFAIDAIHYSSMTVVPLPAGIWLFASGLIALGVSARRRVI